MTRIVTADELARANGEDGAPMWVAANDKVYDVSDSRLWRAGRHMNRHQAGADLMADLAGAPHDADLLDRMPVIGELQRPEPADEDDRSKPAESSTHVEAPAPIGLLLAQHPHPMSVHFPIALSISAAAFQLLSILFGVEILRSAALFNLIFAAIVTPWTLLTGYLSWRYEYGRSDSATFKGKINLSIAYCALILVILAIRLFVPSVQVTDSAFFWLYSILLIGLAPLVMTLGYLGGKITFP